LRGDVPESSSDGNEVSHVALIPGPSQAGVKPPTECKQSLLESRLGRKSVVVKHLRPAGLVRRDWGWKPASRGKPRGQRGPRCAPWQRRQRGGRGRPALRGGALVGGSRGRCRRAVG